MRPGDVLKPLGVFVVVILVVLAGTAVVASLSGSGASGDADGADVDGQSPDHYQPDNVVADADPEDGDISVDGDGEDKRILVDTKHSNQFDRVDLEPLVETLVQAGHTVDLQTGSGDSSGGFGQTGYSNATLQRYDAVFAIAPTGSYSDRELAALESFTEGDGRVVLLGEPTQFSTGSSALGSISAVRASGDDLAGRFGLRIGADTLYNMDDEGTDNNYRSIYASPDADGSLTDGVDRMQFDTAGYVVRTGDSDARILARAVEGTRTLDRGETGQYPVAAQNGNFVLVADASFVDGSELYDADNEQFVSNLLTFLVSGDKDEDVPPTEGTATPGGP